MAGRQCDMASWPFLRRPTVCAAGLFIAAMQHHRTPVQYSFVAFLFYSKKGTEVAFDVASCWPLRCSMERRQASKRRAERSLANGRAALLACLAAAASFACCPWPASLAAVRSKRYVFRHTRDSTRLDSKSHNFREDPTNIGSTSC